MQYAVTDLTIYLSFRSTYQFKIFEIYCFLNLEGEAMNRAH